MPFVEILSMRKRLIIIKNYMDFTLIGLDFFY